MRRRRRDLESHRHDLRDRLDDPIDENQIDGGDRYYWYCCDDASCQRTLANQRNRQTSLTIQDEDEDDDDDDGEDDEDDDDGADGEGSRNCQSAPGFVLNGQIDAV